MVCMGVIRSSSYLGEILKFGSYMTEHLKDISYKQISKKKYRVRAELHSQVMINRQVIFQNGTLLKFPPTISSP
jgi:hypothetical protein